MPIRKNLWFFCLSILLLSACNGYEKLLKSSDVNLKLSKANEYYDKKYYQHANQLYESLLPVMKHTRNYEQLYYRYSYTFYYMKDYLSASYHFKNFTEFFPSSKDAVECEFMYGLCLYKYSPKYSLDPTNTIKAMEALQSFVNVHPESKYATEANTYVKACRDKMEMKAASAAKLYYDIGQYKAASVAYKSVMHSYPESPKMDMYQYMEVRALYHYAHESVKEKQEERYAGMITAYHELVDEYPKSSYLRDAEKYYTQADNHIKQLRDEHK
ncbi:MAG: hypothetical protein BGO69_16655 [Bacteroidetes bacterium 46-16]|nr:MAG: hypothetical protein BGO69_16655 [Bacteroidetes bacterium 46-16]